MPARRQMAKTPTSENDLTEFHLSCVPEYKVTLKSYNILFYGYGSKISMLEKMFPRAHFIKELPADLKKYTVNVLINAKLEELSADFLPKHGIVCLLDTMSPSKINFSQFDLENLNFILKDLTTYEPYINNELTGNEKNLNNLIANVSLRSRKLFKLLVQSVSKNKIAVTEFLNIAKKEMLINSQKSVRQLLSEFFDHKIVKIVNDEFVISVRVENILKSFENTEKTK